MTMRTPVSAVVAVTATCVWLLAAAGSLSNIGTGVCYYPEQWSSDQWAADAQEMAQLGLKYVRIGEFMWDIINPSQGRYSWDLLDAAIETLGSQGLQVVLGTPTATPPKWIIDAHTPEEILPYGIDGNPRRFGSRRHYSFSSPVYQNYTRDIVTQLAMRYGNNPHVAVWQVDNEYGCHDTVRTYDPNALVAFRAWLRNKYANDVSALNEAWGNVFWSMRYASFDEIDLPNLAVTELNPAHRLDFYRFSSDQVIAYNKLQVDIIRQHSSKPITTNFMGFFFQFDAFKLAEDLDFASWDSYPLGFTDTTLGLGNVFTEAQQEAYTSTGHPDLASFHHDLYRAIGRGNLWIMEQQPGPVNWADHNPSPAPGMVKLWTLEAVGHGVDTVSYFRWRQSAFAQEQMHSGLHRRDFAQDFGYFEAQNAIDAMNIVRGGVSSTSNPKALILFSFESQWVSEIEPQSKDFSFVAMLFNIYSSLRSVGFDVDFMSLDQILTVNDFSPYSVILIPGLSIVSQEVVTKLKSFSGDIVIGIRSGSKTDQFQIPENLPPSTLQELIPVKAIRVESLRPGVNYPVCFYGKSQDCFNTSIWREILETGAERTSLFADFNMNNRTSSAMYQTTPSLVTHYLGYFLDVASFQQYLVNYIPSTPFKSPLQETLRVVEREGYHFATNYDVVAADIPAEALGCSDPQFVYGTAVVQPREVSIWKCISVADE